MYTHFEPRKTLENVYAILEIGSEVEKHAPPVGTYSALRKERVR